MNLLFFQLEDIKIVANNEVDLESHLIKCGFTNIEFSDLRTNYGTCYLKSVNGRETAKCFYVTKI